MKNRQEYAKIESNNKLITPVIEFIKSFKYLIINRLFDFKNEESKVYALKALLLRYILLYYLLVMTREIKTYNALSNDDAKMTRDEQLKHFNSVFENHSKFFSSFFSGEDNKYEHAFMTLLNFLSFSPKEIFQLGKNPIMFKDISFTKEKLDGDDTYNVIKTYHNDMDVVYKLNESINLSIISIANKMKEMFNLDFTSSVLKEIGLNNKIIASHEVGIFENSIDITEFNELKIPKTLLYKPPLNTDGDIIVPDEYIKIEEMKIMQFDDTIPTYCLCSDIHGSVSKLIIFFMQTKLIQLKDSQGSDDYYTFIINTKPTQIKRYVLGDYLTIKDHVQTKLTDVTSDITVPQILTIISLIIAFHSTGKCVFLRGNHELMNSYINVPFLRKLPLFKTLTLNNRIVILSHTSPYKALYDKLHPKDTDQDAYKNIHDPDKASEAFLNDYRTYFDNLSKEYDYSTLEKKLKHPLTNKGETLRYVLDNHGPYYHRYSGKNNKIKVYTKYEGNFMPKNLNILSIYGHDDSESFAYFDQNGTLQNKTGRFNSDGIFDTTQIKLSNDIHEKYAREFGDDYLSSFSKTLTDYINNKNFKTGALCIDTTSDYRSVEYNIDDPTGNPVGSLSTLGILVIQENTSTNYTALFVKSVILSPTTKFRAKNTFSLNRFIKSYASYMVDDIIKNKADYTRIFEECLKSKDDYMRIIGECLKQILTDSLNDQTNTYTKMFKEHIACFRSNSTEKTCQLLIKKTDLVDYEITEYQENDYVKFSNGSERKVRNLYEDVQIYFHNINKEFIENVRQITRDLLLFPSNINEEEIALLTFTILIKRYYQKFEVEQKDLDALIEKAIPYEFISGYVKSIMDRVSQFKTNQQEAIPSIRVRGGNINKNMVIFGFLLLIFTILIIVIVVHLLSHNSPFNESFRNTHKK